jgi:hypothetical protein
MDEPAPSELPAASALGEREFQPRTTGVLFPWVKRVSLVELAIFACLLVVWAIPGLEHATFLFGMTHGLGFILLCILIWIAVMRREVPFWLLAAALTPVGPVGSSIGVEYIERKEKRERAEFEATHKRDDPPKDEVFREAGTVAGAEEGARQ